MSYLIKKDKKNNTIMYMEYNLDGYKFTPKKNASNIQVNQLIIINPSLIDKILTIKFNNMYKKLLNYIMQILNTDNPDDNSNAAFALTEIDRLKSIIINKYKKYISIEKQQQFLAQLNMLDNHLKMRMMMSYNIPTYTPLEEELSQGRGR